MNICIGIDPSINSTGVSILYGNNPPLFFNIKSHLTKYEGTIDIPGFVYVKYTKDDVVKNVHTDEVIKTNNFINICDAIKNIIEEYADPLMKEEDDMIVCMEGISYGSSVRTKSVYDLAGLNFLIRYRLTEMFIPYIIAPPSEIKKFVTGKGNSDKEQIVSCFLNLFPQYEPINRNSTTKIDDVADAYFMAQYAKNYKESCT